MVVEGDIRAFQNMRPFDALKLQAQVLTARQPGETFAFLIKNGREAIAQTDATKALVENLRAATRFDFAPVELNSAIRQAFDDKRDTFLQHDLESHNVGTTSEMLVLAPRLQQPRARKIGTRHMTIVMA